MRRQTQDGLVAPRGDLLNGRGEHGFRVGAQPD